jgi:UDP-N-acetylglucosamine/UDP-N-acetylgalactosamine diphosphorylase
MSSKVVRKRDWKEPVGVIGMVDGRLGVIEYSDIPDDVARQTEADGSLRFWAGSIAIHVLNVEFVERLNRSGFRLPYHMARKAVPCVRADGKAVELKKGEKNGVKFETFVFDALCETRRSVTMETAREVDFGPVKNATGEDSAESARQFLVNQYGGWLEAAGHRIPRKADGTPDCVLEISPLTSLGGEGLQAAKVPPIKAGDKVAL